MRVQFWACWSFAADAPAEDGGADSWRFSRDRLPDPEGEGEVDHFQVKQRRNDREIATAE
jgi:hypothetical protein